MHSEQNVIKSCVRLLVLRSASVYSSINKRWATILILSRKENWWTVSSWNSSAEHLLRARRAALHEKWTSLELHVLCSPAFRARIPSKMCVPLEHGPHVAPRANCRVDTLACIIMFANAHNSSASCRNQCQHSICQRHQAHAFSVNYAPQTLALLINTTLPPPSHFTSRPPTHFKR